MACPNKNRHRPRTVAFRLTDDEFIRLEQRVKITGEAKGDYLREMALNGEINISVGKFKSDKLALAFKSLSNELETAIIENMGNVLSNKVRECLIMISELYYLMDRTHEEISA